MGTRSLTCVLNNNKKYIITMYRQYDGYPEGHGKELANFLKKITIINGISGQKMGDAANGIECLAAQMVAHFKNDIGGIYLYPPKTRDVGEEYIYTIYPVGYKIYMKVQSFDNKAFFDDNVNEFDAFLESIANKNEDD